MSDILEEEELTAEEAEALYNEFAAMPEDIIECQTVHKPCSEPVAWLAIAPCCNERTLLCDSHKRRAEITDNEAFAQALVVFPQWEGKLRCPFCNELSPNYIYVPV